MTYTMKPFKISLLVIKGLKIQDGRYFGKKKIAHSAK